MFAHGKEELMSPGEFIKKKRYRKKVSEPSIKKLSPKPQIEEPLAKIEEPLPKITSPLNPKAKEFEMKKPFKTSWGQIKVEEEDHNDYETYWKIIHELIIKEGEERRFRSLLPHCARPVLIYVHPLSCYNSYWSQQQYWSQQRYRLKFVRNYPIRFRKYG
jgi:hypothetical protein